MKRLFYFLILINLNLLVFSQETKDISQMTKEDVLELTYDELLEMPFEDVLKLANIVGVSLEDLYEMLLNKDVISASKKVETSFEAPLSSTVISYEEIITSGARSIDEALRLVPGMIIREKTSGNFDIHIRGNDNLPPNHMLVYSENSITLVMIDGRPVYNYVHGGTFWETLPIGIDDVDRIEVIRGPSSALYGANAVSGVVNIITKKNTNKKLSADLNLQAGTLNSIISSFGICRKVNSKLILRFTGNIESFERNSEKLYVHKYNGIEWGPLTKRQLDTLRTYSTIEQSWFKVFDPKDNIDEMYPNPKLSRERIGLNGYIIYEYNKNINYELKGGYQKSDVLSTTMGDNPTAYAGRVSNTAFTDLNIKIYGLRAQFNYMGGWQDIVRSDTGFKTLVKNLNSTLEYDFQLGNLNLRPGFVYQYGKYDDSPFLRYKGQGFLNGEKLLTTTGLSIRADYLLLEKLRLIAAIRGDKYNINSDIYFSYQAIASYNIKDKHNFRIVSSRANRGPFLVDSYSNFLWERNERPMPGYIRFIGQENLDQLTMNMIEIGYRIKPTRKIQADFEYFINRCNNYGALYPDSVNLNGYQTVTDRPWVSMKYRNIELSSKQVGLTGSISWVATEKILIKVFGTYQKTMLYDVIPISPDSATNLMISDAYSNFITNGTTYSNQFPEERIDKMENRTTPAFYGGMYFTAKFWNERFTLGSTIYSYSSQVFQSKYSEKIVDEKVILNLKLSYKLVTNNIMLFINAKNILSKKREFAYMDEIGSLYLLGLSYNL